jgi:hypothetical protein
MREDGQSESGFERGRCGMERAERAVLCSPWPVVGGGWWVFVDAEIGGVSLSGALDLHVILPSQDPARLTPPSFK